jgi:hypothetical protein
VYTYIVENLLTPAAAAEFDMKAMVSLVRTVAVDISTLHQRARAVGEVIGR